MLSDKKILNLKPEDIKIPEKGLRLKIDQTELRLLAGTIIANGLAVPLNVKREEDGSFSLVSGERRLRASILAGLRRVPCVIHKTDCLNELLMSLNENMQREPLHFIELGFAVERLKETFGLSIGEIALKLGLDRTDVPNKLKILKFSEEILQKIYGSNLSEEHIIPLIRLSPELRMGVLDYIITKELSVKQAKEYVEEIINPKHINQPQKPIRKYALGDERLFQNSLNKLCDTLQNGGMSVHLSKNENDLFTEYRVRIRKELPDIKAEQLKIC